jgi:transcriptional regulator GlxA family with amidase domain
VGGVAWCCDGCARAALTLSRFGRGWRVSITDRCLIEIRSFFDREPAMNIRLRVSRYVRSANLLHRIEDDGRRFSRHRDEWHVACAYGRIPIPIPAAGGLAPWQVSKVKLYVEVHLSDDITCPELATLVRLSPSHFSRAFKVSFRCSPLAYVVAQRLDHAKALMLSTEAPLCEVALVCGFADQSHFSTKFHRAVGRTPSAWRRLNASSAPG